MLLGTRDINIFEYDRYGGSLQPFTCTSTYTDGVRMPMYTENIGESKKIDILCSVSRFKQKKVLQNFFGNTKLFVLLLTYWVKHAKPQVDSIYITCLILCHFVLNTRNICNAKTYNSRNLVERALLSMRESCVEEFSTMLTRFIPYLTKDSSYFAVRIVHGFSQYQSSFAFGTYLNQLLGCPLPLLSPQEVFNGTFLYNFYVCYLNYDDEKVDTNINSFFNI